MQQAGVVSGKQSRQVAYPYLLVLANFIFIGLAIGAILDSIDTQLRHQLSGSSALLLTGGAQWYFTRKSGHPVWRRVNPPALGSAPTPTFGVARGRCTTVCVAMDVLLVPLLFVVA